MALSEASRNADGAVCSVHCQGWTQQGDSPCTSDVLNSQSLLARDVLKFIEQRGQFDGQRQIRTLSYFQKGFERARHGMYRDRTYQIAW